MRNEVESVRTRTRLWCVWAGLPYIVLFVIGMVVAHVVPPWPPGYSASHVASIFAQHADRIRIGAIIILAAQGLFAVWFAEVTVQLRRIEGRHSTLAFAQLALGATVILIIIWPMFFLIAASFRPRAHSTQTYLLLSDLTWLPFVGAWFTVVPEYIVTGIVILSDRSPNPIFPRWAGYANLWVATLSLPSTALFFLKTGPFAWNGLMAFWFAAFAFFCWLTFMTILMVRSIKRQAQSAAVESGDYMEELAREVVARIQQEPSLVDRLGRGVASGA
jgi:hypothetical protein